MNTNISREDIFSVSDINRVIKGLLDQSLSTVWIEGEVANYTSHSSGHIYFSLKDANSTLRCSFFRQYNIESTLYPQNGDKLLCYGKIDVYEKSGSYQLIVRKVLPAGVGELQLKFLALKEKLASEGLFEQIHKRALPEFPETIGVITSPTGAAFQDIKNVLNRRFPCDVFLYPASVQGDRAAPELIEGIFYFNTYQPVELIIIGRGGGSQEDLFCFNDEQLARTIFNSQIPIISAVGHEIDFSIADFVADLRAPTPSAAAEIATPDREEVRRKLLSLQKEITSVSRQHLLRRRNNIGEHRATLYQYHPQKLLFNYQQQLDEASQNFKHKMETLGNLKAKVEEFKGRLLYLGKVQSSDLIHQNQIYLERMNSSLLSKVDEQVNRARKKQQDLEQNLLSLSPYEALRKGYAILQRDSKLVKSVKQLEIDQQIEILLQDGKCQCRVENLVEE